MNNDGPKDPPETDPLDGPKDGALDGPVDGDAPKDLGSDRANKLFGHKGGAKPWDKPASVPSAAQESQPRTSPVTSSAAYPRDAQYTPRPETPAVTAPVREPSAILGTVDDDAELTKLHPNYKLLMRAKAVIFALIMTAAAAVLDGALSSEFGWPFGFIAGPALLLGLFLVIRIPGARYNARGYQISLDRLRVVRGVMWHSDTIVPFSRVQHIDVDQGPIERALGIATMTLHTAGSHNASVGLPGLGHELAVSMREEIRAHIKRESM